MHTDTRFKTTRANTDTHAWGLFLSLHWTVKGYVYHKGDATAGRGFFPKYDKRDYMDIAKMLYDCLPGRKEETGTCHRRGQLDVLLACCLCGNLYHSTTMLSARASATPQSHLYCLSHGASSLSICVTRSYHGNLRGPILHPSSSCK